MSDPATNPNSIEGPGSRIGRYKLLQQIGEGGCGVVFMAEQEEPLRRLVALKVIKPGMDTKNVIARFEAERQALALMNHPNIAQVLDAGTTANGRPYFVMELVRGLTITEYCDEHFLSTEERLQLFMQICSAVQHAHQKGIIHRDIKPHNILVTISTEGKPTPKVIDFGIAKATTGERLTDKTLFTAFEMMIGTPAYMSPEQADLASVDIDTRSDIYSLGVLLYELLTGTTPFDTKELLKSGLDEVRRVIRTCDPVRPSTCLNSMAVADLTSISQRRRTEPTSVIRELRGDLDWIVMKALEKDRNRRYVTANALAIDVKRSLEHEAILARPPSVIYKLQMLYLRNKLALASITVIFVLLFVALAVTTRLVVLQQRGLKLSAAVQLEATAYRDVEERKYKEARATLAEALAIRRQYLDGEPPPLEAFQYVAYTMMGSVTSLDEAVEMIDQMLTPRVLARFECADFIALRVELRARAGKWTAAVPDAMLLVQQHPDNFQYCHLLAPLLVATTNLSAHQNLCWNMLAHFDGTTNVFTADQLSRDCLVLPSSGVDVQRVAGLAKLAVTKGKDNPWSFHFYQCDEALAQYRLGNYNEATTISRECVIHPSSHTRAECCAIIAMAQHKLGDQRYARSALANCNHVIEHDLSAPAKVLDQDWRDWIFAHALQAEANQMLGGDLPSTTRPANSPQ